MVEVPSVYDGMVEVPSVYDGRCFGQEIIERQGRIFHPFLVFEMSSD